jgi:PAS domain S-box-containing protein
VAVAVSATLQDTSYRIVDVNQAYLDFSGFSRDQLIGIDPLLLQPEEDRRPIWPLGRHALALQRGEVLPLIERRITTRTDASAGSARHAPNCKRSRRARLPRHPARQHGRTCRARTR